MSVEGMQVAWQELFDRARWFYDFARDALIEGETLGGDALPELQLDGILGASEAIRSNADEVLVEALGDEYRRLSMLLIAAASVDAMLAADLVTLDPELGADRRRRVAEGEESPSALQEERIETLQRVYQLFLDEELPLRTGGALPDGRRQLVEATHGTTASLVELAMIPSPRLLQGLGVAMTGGAAEVLVAVQHVDLLADLEGTAAAVVNRAPRFLREHAAKMLTLRADAKVVGEVLNQLIVRTPLESLFVSIASCGAANLKTEKRIVEAATIGSQAAAQLEADLAALLPDYRRHMEWVGTSAKWLRRGASPLTHLVAPFVGHAAICGVFVLGIGYVAYSLADRIDARNLGFADRIKGVVPLVEERV